MKKPNRSRKNKVALPIPEAHPAPHRFISKKFRMFVTTISLDEMANILANYNSFNRPLTGPLDEYQRDVEAGDFRYDVGNVIEFDVRGNVTNGQHRLVIHWLAQKPFKTIVFVGLPLDAILYKDCHATRKSSINPMLYESLLRGVPATKEEFKNKEYQHSLARFLLIYACDWAKKGFAGMRKERCYQTNKTAINLAMKGVVLKGLRKALRWTRRPGARAAISLYATRFPSKAAALRDDLYSNGENIISGSPVDMLRKHLMANTSNGGEAMYVDFRVSLEAIQAYHQGQRFMKTLPQRWQWDF